MGTNVPPLLITYLVFKRKRLLTLNRILLFQGTWLLNRGSFLIGCSFGETTPFLPDRGSSLDLEMGMVGSIWPLSQRFSKVISHMQFHLLLSLDPGVRCSCAAYFSISCHNWLLPVFLIALDWVKSDSLSLNIFYIFYWPFIFSALFFFARLSNGLLKNCYT